MNQEAKDIFTSMLDKLVGRPSQKIGPMTASAIEILTDLKEAAKGAGLKVSHSLVPKDTDITLSLTFVDITVNIVYNFHAGTWYVYRMGSDSESRTALFYRDGWRAKASKAAVDDWLINNESGVVHLAKCVAEVALKQEELR